MPWRSAPAWPETPPPWIVAMTSKRPTVSVTLNGVLDERRRAPRDRSTPRRSCSLTVIDAGAGHEADAGDRGLAAAGAVVDSLVLSHALSPPA